MNIVAKPRAANLLLAALPLLVILLVSVLPARGQQGTNRAFLPVAFHGGATASWPQPPPTRAPELATTYFTGCASLTGNNASIAIPANITISGSLVLEAGDEVAVFRPDGSLCAGVTQWTGQNIAITAWGDDTVTGPVDGLLNGEKMLFRFWDSSTNQQYEATAVVYSMGDGNYGANTLHVMSAVTVGSPTGEPTE